MPLSAFCAVLLAAACHAVWNLSAKRAAGCRQFVWIYSVCSVVVWLPAVAWVLWRSPPHWQLIQALALGATAILHLLYSLALQAGYRAADLSLVYPIARGTGPLLSFAGAATLLGERPGPLAVLGLLLIVAGIALIANLYGLVRSGRRARGTLSGIFWGALTGCCIAAYTLNDGWAVKALAISPLLIDFTGNCFRVVVLSPQALAPREQLGAQLRQYLRPALIVAVLAPLGYLLVLFAMRVAPISHVAPARELATLAGTWFGARLLAEPAGSARLLGAVFIVLGVACLAL